MKKIIFVFTVLAIWSSTGYAQTRNQNQNRTRQPHSIDTPQRHNNQLKDYDQHNRMNRNDTIRNNNMNNRNDGRWQNRDTMGR